MPKKIQSRNELERFQIKNLRSILDYSYQNSAFYRRKFDKARVKPPEIKTIKDFVENVPFTGKLELLENQKENPPFGQFLAVTTEKIRRIFVSPGPILEPYTNKDKEVYSKVLCKAWSICGIQPGDVVQVTFNYHLMPAGLIMQDSFEKFGCTVLPAGVGETQRQVELMKKIGTTVYVGTPSFLGRIKDVAEEMGIDPKKDLDLRIAICGAEPLPPTLRKELEETFELEIFDAYGTAETGQISQECNKHEGMHLNEDFFFVELIDPNTLESVGPGEEGEIVVTPFFKEAMPLIRFRTGDASVLNDEICECGSVENRLERILGRVDMLTKVRGVFIHPKTVENVLRNYPELGKFQIVVERPARFDVLTVNVEYKETVKDLKTLRNMLERALKDALKLDTSVRLLETGQIPREAKILDDRRIFQ